MRILLAIMALAATGCAPVAAPQVAAPDGIAIAQQVIAAERAFAARAQTEGQWTAFRATAARDAWMFVPQPVRAQDWLGGRADPPASVTWQPHRVVVACDGTLAATTGAAQWPDGGHGQFTTIWQRDADGGWRWIADHGTRIAAPLPAPATPVVEIAACRGAEGPPPRIFVNDQPVGGSQDGTLVWDFVPGPNGGLRVTMWIGPRYAPTIEPGATPR